MSRNTNIWAKVADVPEFSVTETYEKVCVSEGVISIVIDVPRLRHVGASWGAASDCRPTQLALPDARHPINSGPIYDGLSRGCRTKNSGITPASICMPTANGAIVRGHTNAKTQKTLHIIIRYLRRPIASMSKTCVIGEMAKAP